MPGPDTSYIAHLGGSVIGVINGILVPVLFAICFIIFLYGVAKAYIFSGGEERAEGHRLILWGLIGFAVMLSVWGLVNIVTNTFGLDRTGAPPGSELPQGPTGL